MHAFHISEAMRKAACTLGAWDKMENALWPWHFSLMVLGKDRRHEKEPCGDANQDCRGEQAVAGVRGSSVQGSLGLSIQPQHRHRKAGEVGRTS